MAKSRWTRFTRALEDGLDALGHWVTNRPTRQVVRRELGKRVRRVGQDVRDQGAAIARLLRVRARKATK